MIQISIEGPICPKARPRFSGRRAHLPPRYRDWKAQAIAQILAQYEGPPIARAAIEIKFYGPLRGDLDNLAGAVLDALVPGGVLKDDRLSCLPSLRIEHFPGKVKRASIAIANLDGTAIRSVLH